jgi:hypothetical protein
VPQVLSLTEGALQELLSDLNYLNLSEIRSFCKRHSIPYAIAIETGDGRRRKSGDVDRKGVMLGRIHHFLQTGTVMEETCFPAAVVCFDPPVDGLTANDRLFYGQYDKTSPAMLAILRDLTGGRFKNGAVARIVAREFWSRGDAPTFREYAAAWLKAVREHTGPNPEWAYLSDIARGGSDPEWKKLRASKAKAVMTTLDRIVTR